MLGDATQQQPEVHSNDQEPAQAAPSGMNSASRTFRMQSDRHAWVTDKLPWGKLP